MKARKQIQFVNEAMWALVQAGYYRTHGNHVDEDKVDDILSDHTLTGEFYFVDAAICDDIEQIEESALGSLIKYRRSLNQKEIENTFKLCRIARTPSHHTKHLRKSINF